MHNIIKIYLYNCNKSALNKKQRIHKEQKKQWQKLLPSSSSLSNVAISDLKSGKSSLHRCTASCHGTSSISEDTILKHLFAGSEKKKTKQLKSTCFNPQYSQE